MATKKEVKEENVEEVVDQAVNYEEEYKKLIEVLEQDKGPVVLTVGVNRVTGALGVAISGNLVDPVADLTLLINHLDNIRRNLENQRLSAATAEKSPPEDQEPEE